MVVVLVVAFVVAVVVVVIYVWFWNIVYKTLQIHFINWPKQPTNLKIGSYHNICGEKAVSMSGSSHPPLEGHENVKLTLSEPSC